MAKNLIQRLYDYGRIAAYSAVAIIPMTGCNKPEIEPQPIPQLSEPYRTPKNKEPVLKEDKIAGILKDIEAERPYKEQIRKQGNIEMFANEPSKSPVPEGLSQSNTYTSEQQQMAYEGINPNVFPTRKAYEDWKNQSESQLSQLTWDLKKGAYFDGKEYFYPTKNQNIFQSKSGNKIAINPVH